MKTEMEIQPKVEEGFGCLTPSYGFDRIKADPQLLGRFLGACATLKPLEREAREAATAFALAGRPVPNCQLVDDRNLTAVSAKAIIEAVHLPNHLPTQIEKYKAFVHLVAPISATLYKAFCKKIGAKPKTSRIEKRPAAPYVICSPAGLLPK
jgi:hypothetical protein